MSDGRKQLMVFDDLSSELEIKDDKGIDKRNPIEIGYSFNLKFS